MTGIHSYSRATAPFEGVQLDVEWLQTVIEFEHGWVFLIAAGEGAFLAAAAEHSCDIEEFTERLGDTMPALTAGSGARGGRTGDE